MLLLELFDHIKSVDFKEFFTNHDNTLMVKLFRKYRFAKVARRTKYTLNFVPAVYVKRIF